MIEAKFNFPKLEERLRKGKQRIDMAIAASMQTNRALLFDQEGNYSGHKGWEPLKFRNGMILSNRGILRKSMGPSNDGKTPGRGPDSILEFQSGVVKIGTKLGYAAIQNYGGVIKAKNAKALKIPMPQGMKGTDAAKGQGKFMFRKSVTIPARNFNSITTQDKREFEEAMKAAIVEVLSARG